MPWSAAFFSWTVLSSGGAYAEYGGGQLHSMFVHRAIQGRLLGDEKLPFWGYPRDAVRPELSDIVQRWRTKRYTFGHAETHEIYASHSDIFVEVRSDIIRVLGGNVGDTVATETGDGTWLIQEYVLDDDVFIESGQKVISVLKNRAHLIKRNQVSIKFPPHRRNRKAYQNSTAFTPLVFVFSVLLIAPHSLAAIELGSA